MKVQELIEKLKNSDPDATVFIRDCDTDWALHILEVKKHDGFVELSGSYVEGEYLVKDAPEGTGGW